MAAALPAIGIIGSLAGTAISAVGQSQQSHYQEAVARNEAILQQQKANEDAALGQRAAITEARKTQLVQSRVQALAAASGTDALSPSTVDLQGDIAQQGEYNAMVALSEGMRRSVADKAQADIDLFKADRISSALPLTEASTIIGGLSKAALLSSSKSSSSNSFLNLFGGS